MTTPQNTIGSQRREEEIAMALRILFSDAVRLVPAGIKDADEFYRWQLHITDEIVQGVLRRIEASEERCRELEEALRNIPHGGNCPTLLYGDYDPRSKECYCYKGEVAKLISPSPKSA